jgi:hypothetical protein
MIMEKCITCNGTGIINVFIDCGRPASECCGGCTTPADCTDCNSEGTLETLEDNYQDLKFQSNKEDKT